MPKFNMIWNITGIKREIETGRFEMRLFKNCNDTHSNEAKELALKVRAMEELLQKINNSGYPQDIHK